MFFYILSEALDYLSSAPPAHHKNKSTHSHQHIEQYGIETYIRLSTHLMAYLAKIFPKAIVALRRGCSLDAFAML